MIKTFYYFLNILGIISLFSTENKAMDNEDPLDCYRVQTFSSSLEKGYKEARKKFKQEASKVEKIKEFPAFFLELDAVVDATHRANLIFGQIVCPNKEKAEDLMAALSPLSPEVSPILLVPKQIASVASFKIEALKRHHWKQ